MAHPRGVTRLARCDEPHPRPELHRVGHPYRSPSRGMAGSAGGGRLLHHADSAPGDRHWLGVCEIWQTAAGGGSALRSETGHHCRRAPGAVGPGTHRTENGGAGSDGRHPVVRFPARAPAGGDHEHRVGRGGAIWSWADVPVLPESRLGAVRRRRRSSAISLRAFPARPEAWLACRGEDVAHLAVYTGRKTRQASRRELAVGALQQAVTLAGARGRDLDFSNGREGPCVK